MQDSQNQAQNPVIAPTASVTVGGAEGAPVSVGGLEGAPKIEAAVAPEVSVEVAPAEKKPELSEEEKEFGVDHSPEPQIPTEARVAGVTESIPSHLDYNPPKYTSVQEAEHVANKTSQAFSLAWISEIVAKNLKRLKPQEVK